MEFLRALEGIRSPFLDTVIGLITQLGEETAAIIIICVIFWCINKNTAYFAGVVYFLSGMTVQGMKILFRIDRPWVADPTLNPVVSALEHATGYSFPSGHTQAAAALYGSLGTSTVRRWASCLFFAIPLLVAFSRMYLGVHTPQDVIVSLLICAAFIALVYFFFCSGTANDKRDLFVSLLILFFAAAASVIAAVLYSQGKIAENYISDCLKAAGASAGFAAGFYIERKYICFPVKSKNLIWQAVKLILGIAGVLVIKEGLKLIIGTGLIVDTFRYFLMIAWVIVLYPLIIKRFFAKED